MKFLYNREERAIEYYTHAGKYIAHHKVRLNSIDHVKNKLSPSFYEEVVEFLKEEGITFKELIDVLKLRQKKFRNIKNRIICTERVYSNLESVN